MAKNKAIQIGKEDFTQLDTYDKLYREHDLMRRMLRERIVLLQGAILEKSDPALLEKYKKEIIHIGIDWEKKQIILIPTTDPEKKAEEATDLIKNYAKN